jgi:hypothetical protein
MGLFRGGYYPGQRPRQSAKDHQIQSPDRQPTNLPQLPHHYPGVEGVGNQRRAADAGIARCAQSLSDPSHQSFRHVRATGAGTGAGRLRRDVRDRTTKLMFSKVAICLRHIVTHLRRNPYVYPNTIDEDED